MAEQQGTWPLGSQGERAEASELAIYGLVGWAFGHWKPRAAMEINLLKTK